MMQILTIEFDSCSKTFEINCGIGENTRKRCVFSLLRPINLKVNIVALKLRVVKCGRAWTLYAIEHNGQCRLNEFMNEVSLTHADEFAKLESIIDRLAETGPLTNEHIFKPLRRDFWEIKTGVLRLICFTRGESIFVTRGFIKQTQRTPNDHIKEAIWLRSEFLVAEQRGQVEII